MARLAACVALVVPLVRRHLLTQDGKVSLVRRQAQHDEVSIQAVQDVACVGVEAWLCALLANERHDLVLALKGAQV